MLYSSKRGMVHEFIRILVFLLYLASEHLIVVGSFFSQVVDHVKATERACIETYRGAGKRLC